MLICEGMEFCGLNTKSYHPHISQKYQCPDNVSYHWPPMYMGLLVQVSKFSVMPQSRNAVHHVKS